MIAYGSPEHYRLLVNTIRVVPDMDLRFVALLRQYRGQSSDPELWRLLFVEKWRRGGPPPSARPVLPSFSYR